MRLILGSRSPQRRALLDSIAIKPYRICAANIDETVKKGELARKYTNRIALKKIDAIYTEEHDLVLCADTVVAVGRRILQKPQNTEQAKQFVKLLSGRRHRVITTVALKTNIRVWQRTVVTRVRFKRLSDRELSAFIASGEWRGKAGGYAIQGMAGPFIIAINGSYSNVVGLPLMQTCSLLTAAGYPLIFNRAIE